MEMLNHFGHPKHQLILSHADNDDEHLCNACQEPVGSGPTYACQEGCYFYLHEKCIDLPEQINHPCHEHPLQLFSEAFDGTGSCQCNICKKTNRGFTYRCVECNFDVDVPCSKLTVELKPLVRFEDDRHLYFLFRNIKFVKEYTCEDCGTPCYKDLPVMSCVHCADGHQRHVHCLPIELPSEVNHKHIHPLVFKERFVEEGDWEEYCCDDCTKSRDVDHPVYCCVECLYFAHVTCVFLEKLPPLITKSKSTTEEGAESARAQLNREMAELEPKIKDLELKIKALDDESRRLKGELDRVLHAREELIAKLSTF